MNWPWKVKCAIRHFLDTVCLVHAWSSVRTAMSRSVDNNSRYFSRCLRSVSSKNNAAVSSLWAKWTATAILKECDDRHTVNLSNVNLFFVARPPFNWRDRFAKFLVWHIIFGSRLIFLIALDVAFIVKIQFRYWTQIIDKLIGNIAWVQIAVIHNEGKSQFTNWVSPVLCVYSHTSGHVDVAHVAKHHIPYPVFLQRNLPYMYALCFPRNYHQTQMAQTILAWFVSTFVSLETLPRLIFEQSFLGLWSLPFRVKG